MNFILALIGVSKGGSKFGSNPINPEATVTVKRFGDDFYSYINNTDFGQLLQNLQAFISLFHILIGLIKNFGV